MLRHIIILGSFANFLLAELPTELDPFLEKLFETDECEEFLSTGEFLSVATIECDPFKCDFPRQLCMRPANKYQDKTFNMCKDLPTECVTAANGGVPVGPPKVVSKPKPVPVVLPGTGVTAPSAKPFGGLLGPSPPPPGPAPPPPIHNVRPRDICEMGPPVGRFCGFAQKFVYNKETGECDEFWFPGCKTEETNANLFDTRRQCERIAEICARLATPPPTTQPPFRPRTRTIPPPPPPPPMPQPPPLPQGGMFGGLGALGGLGGALGGAGAGGGGGETDGEEGGNQGLFGLIQQGIMSAQQIKQGGKGAIPGVVTQQAQSLLKSFGFDNLFGG